MGVLVGGDILCCHPPSGILTGPLYEDPKRVPYGVIVLLLSHHKHTPPLELPQGVLRVPGHQQGYQLLTGPLYEEG